MATDQAASDYPQWIRQEADALLTDFPHLSLASHARELDRSAESFEGGVRVARDIAAEMRRRDAAGTRFWPTPAIVSSD